MSPQFHYQAKNGPNEIVEGTIDADNYAQAVNGITLKGLTPIEVKESVLDFPSEDKASRKILSISLTKKISLSELAVFTRQMSNLLDGAVPLLKAVQLIGNQTSNKKLNQIIHQVEENVRNGSAFSDALAQYENVFPSYYVNTVRAGEVGGKLDVVLGRLAGYLEKEQAIAGKVKASLAYPAFVLVIGCLTVFVLLSFVIPRLTVMFEDFDQSLPLMTIVLMHISGFFMKFWWAMIIALLVIFKFLHQWSRSEAGKKWLDTYLLRVWILGPFIQTVEIGRFARTFGTLIESGVTIITALETVTETVGNSVLKEELLQVSSEVAQGTSLGNALKRDPFFPEMAVDMIAIGEESGRFEKGLYKIADVYEQESERMMNTAVSLLGPIVLTIVIIFVGFIIMAVMLPILQMNQLIH
ncbi:MAG: type II secretion system F family protein [Candidatus Omnitrophica bacterium]|nr:type II secretion system F family protein [Candidatus Omnitrophota bacterium]